MPLIFDNIDASLLPGDGGDGSIQESRGCYFSCGSSFEKAQL